MTDIKFDFDAEKAVEVILYLALKRQEITNQPATIRDVVKLMYFADKLSLQKFGRFLCNNNYVAMKQGPVPSEAYNLIKAVRDSNTQPLDKYGFKIQHYYHINLLREPDLDYLSESDILCMDETLAQYGALDSHALMLQSHDVVWSQAWDLFPEKGSVPIEVGSIIDTLDDSEDLLTYLLEGNSD